MLWMPARQHSGSPASILPVVLAGEGGCLLQAPACVRRQLQLFVHASNGQRSAATAHTLLPDGAHCLMCPTPCTVPCCSRSAGGSPAWAFPLPAMPTWPCAGGVVDPTDYVVNMTGDYMVAMSRQTSFLSFFFLSSLLPPSLPPMLPPCCPLLLSLLPLASRQPPTAGGAHAMLAGWLQAGTSRTTPTAC